MDANKKTARIAGLLYLVVVLTGIFSLGYVPSQLTVRGDGPATFNNIVAHEQLFRLGILAGLVCYTFFLLLPLALYKLLKPVSKKWAVWMVALAVVSVPLSFVNILNKFAVLSLISKADYLSAFSPETLRAQVLLYLDLYRNGNDVAQIFWGLWLFPFGYLVFRSGFLPKILGILLILGCFGYVIDFTADFLFSQYYRSLWISSVMTMPASLGEIGTCLWLITVGTMKRASQTLQPSR